jgi:hypothetical protein
MANENEQQVAFKNSLAIINELITIGAAPARISTVSARETFSVSRAMAYFSADELVRQSGHTVRTPASGGRAYQARVRADGMKACSISIA